MLEKEGLNIRVRTLLNYIFLAGVLTHDIEMFVNSWMEMDPHRERCPMVPSGFPSPCAAVDAHVLLVRCRTKTTNSRQTLSENTVFVCFLSAEGGGGVFNAAGSTFSELPRLCQPVVVHGQLLQRPLHVRAAH